MQKKSDEMWVEYAAWSVAEQILRNRGYNPQADALRARAVEFFNEANKAERKEWRERNIAAGCSASVQIDNVE